MDNLKEAVLEWYKKRSTYIELERLSNGFYAPPQDDVCELCYGAQWSCPTGAHLKTPEHIALKHGVRPKMLQNALQDLEFRPSEYAWKSLIYTPNSYLRSAWDRDFGWSPDEAVEAFCEECEEVPGDGCTCGIYCFWNPVRAVEWMSGNVTCKIKIGGDIIEAVYGARAQFARIIAIYNDPDPEVAPRAAEMAELYNVPLVELISKEELGEYL